ncbi:hypothetical protein BN873_260010 [Candidatus Competibacter denitrificans Run_A_D11]|uniref:Uncharacterized protein n=1 Tax=Candidatus Competibacter denitrificans Run_A_D11 TaxID=1400863 RepID=W6M6C1_9GAMM|nr:hypothetical protein BN873_260010 [Candidatus Competibacter denitrificans Run_A_D11]
MRSIYEDSSGREGVVRQVSEVPSGWAGSSWRGFMVGFTGTFSMEASAVCFGRTNSVWPHHN